MAFCSNWNVSLTLSGIQRNVIAWADRPKTCIWQWRTQIIYSCRAVILSHIIWSGDGSKCTFKIPYKNLSTKASRGNEIALWCIKAKGLKLTWGKIYHAIMYLSTRHNGYIQESNTVKKVCKKDYFFLCCSKASDIVRVLTKCPNTRSIRQTIPHLLL